MEAQALGDAAEVLHEQGASQTQGDVPDLVRSLLRNAAVGEHVGEVPLPLRLQHALDLGDVGGLVGREVERAVGDDHVGRAVGEEGEVLGHAVHQLHVGLAVAELLHLPVQVLLCDGQALRAGLDADDLAGRTHELGRQVRVAPRPAAQVHHGAPLQQRRQRGAELMERVLDLGGHVEELVLRLAGHGVLGVARACGSLRVDALRLRDRIVVLLVAAGLGLAVVSMVVHQRPASPIVVCILSI